MTRLLGARRDPGIYTFFDLGVKGPTRSLKAECKPHACKGCARQIRASFQFVDELPRLRVHARGRHGSLQSPSGGLLWTVAEEHVLASKFTAGVQVTAKAVREVFRQSDMPLRCSNSQLHNWVSRTRRNVSGLPPLPKKGLTAAEMRAAASPFITDVAIATSAQTHHPAQPCVRGAASLCHLDMPRHAETRRSCPEQGGEAGHRRQAETCGQQSHCADAVLSCIE